jgi:hypothetical protein
MTQIFPDQNKIYVFSALHVSVLCGISLRLSNRKPLSSSEQDNFAERIDKILDDAVDIELPTQLLDPRLTG